MTSLQLARKIAKFMSDKQAEDVLILDLRDLTTLADYFVIATGTVDVHLKAIVDHVERSLRSLDEAMRANHLEGYTHLRWVLLDYGDVVAHVFQPQVREYYKLEKLWGDAPVERLEASPTTLSSS